MTPDNDEKAAKHFKNIKNTLETIKDILDFVEMSEGFSQPDLAAIEKCVEHLDLAQRALEILWPEVYH